MITPTPDQIDALKAEWTDQYVKVNATKPELARFATRFGKDVVGRVVTVNWTGRAIIDFGDGGWYDITASADCLTKVSADDAKGKYDPKANSAQPVPARGG